MVQTVLITGATGYIGGSVFNHLLTTHEGKYAVTAYVRNEKLVEAIKSVGATPLIGSYDTLDILTKAATEHDIIIHIGDSADHVGSAKAILDGLAARSVSQTPAIYIHTSGTGVVKDKVKGDVAGTKIYGDADPAEIDSVDDSQAHRDVDLLVRDGAKKLEGKAKVAIIIPPLLYGVGSGPGSKVTLGVGLIVRFALKQRFVPIIGEGLNYWNTVHIDDLCRAYTILLDEIQNGDITPWKGYYFAETGEHQWKDAYAAIGKIMFAKGLVDSPTPENPGKKLGYSDDLDAIFQVIFGINAFVDGWGNNSRSRTERLKALGWKKEVKEDFFEYLPKEIDAVVAQWGS